MTTRTARTDFADEHLNRWSDLFTESGFDREVEGALVRMDRLTRLSDDGLRVLLADDPLSHEEFKTLHHLIGGVNRDVPATPAQLASRAGVTRAGMTSRIERLVRNGLVTRSEDPHDRRSVLIAVTPAGRAAWKRIVHRWGEHEQGLFAGLTTAELKRLNALLRKAFIALDRGAEQQAAEGEGDE
ncbi:MarR family winged helix-turn-helix transcriptional regulator [Microlunatus soli]|uniref:DNA-binding transcriptional regulator, MarR family n=1 Tax=Microlunatus soli TaxID=630515 RepID=A0A1H1ZWH6_9ACTN|nr:MarR family transcriptional regulator [Microlunatus soli]SDT37917.1 DNA-binding transcriptional regulator, MarR family [Microlunatus soli]